MKPRLIQTGLPQHGAPTLLVRKNRGIHRSFRFEQAKHETLLAAEMSYFLRKGGEALLQYSKRAGKRRVEKAFHLVERHSSFPKRTDAFQTCGALLVVQTISRRRAITGGEKTSRVVVQERAPGKAESSRKVRDGSPAGVRHPFPFLFDRCLHFPLVSCHEAHLPDVFAGLFLVLSPMCRTSAPCYHFLREVAPANTTTRHLPFAVQGAPLSRHTIPTKEVFTMKKEDNPIRFFRDPSRGAFEIKQCRNGLHAKRPHYHDEISIGLVEKGSCMVSVSEGQFPVCEGHLVLFAPGTLHACRPRARETWGFHMLYLDPAFAEREFGVILPRGAHLVSPSPVRNAENVKDLFTSLIEEDAESTQGRNAIAALLALILAGRHGNQAGSVRPQATEPFPSQLRRMIESSPEDKIPLTFLASQSNTTPTSVLRAFRRNHGVTPHAFQTILRVNRAKKLLLRIPSLAAVANEVGFYDQSHFSKVFRDYCGVTPSFYRSAAGKPN